MPEAGYVFGYAVTLGDGSVSFFEQMRIKPGPLYVLNVYPAGVGPSKFVESLQGDQSVTFINSAHGFRPPCCKRHRRDRPAARAPRAVW